MSKIFGYIKKIEPLYQGVYNIFLFLCKMLLILDILITCWIVLAKIYDSNSCTKLGRRDYFNLNGVYGSAFCNVSY